MSLYEKMKRFLRAKSEENTTKIIHLETVDSTNNYLRKHHSEEQNFTVVETEFQTAGRGQGTNTGTESAFFNTYTSKQNTCCKAISFV